ncbi:MAG: hypothetical protein ACOZF2_08260 [Thermodesulfobacteriota bacterium]
MSRPKGRPRELHGPIVGVKLPVMTHVKLVASAKSRGQSLSRVIRDTLEEAMQKEWGPER